MPKPGEMSKQGDSFEQMINLLYNTGYRLTGSHKKTQELLTSVVEILNGNMNLNTALKNLCLLYKNKATSGWSQNLTKELPEAKSSSQTTKDNSTNKIQTALLTLSHSERLVLVLREVLGLSYAEIAEMIGIEKTAVTGLLSTGRWQMRKQLYPPSGQKRLPEKYSVAK